MKKTVLSLLLFIALSLTSSIGFSQRNEWVNQVVVVNSGKYETAPPFLDYVTVQSYNPVSQTTNVFGTIYTQSAQDIVIHGNMAYVAAHDSIIMYNLDTYARVAAISDSGLSQLYVHNDKLIVTKKYPISRFFVEILNASNLALLARIQNISGDCGEAIVNKDTLYVAVNNGYAGSEGRLAAIAMDTWTLNREINFGPQAVGIWNLYLYGGNIFSINHTPSGSGAVGSITVYDLTTRTYTNKVFSALVSDGCGIRNNLLYLRFNGGIASFNLDTKLIENPSVVDPPMAASVFINSAAIDYIEGNIYTQYGNRPPTFGLGIVISSITGDSITSFTTGLNAESLAIDYRTPVGIGATIVDKPTISLFPNPASDFVSVTYNGTLKHIILTDLTGRTLLSTAVSSGNSFKINCSGFDAGIYIVKAEGSNGMVVSKFIKH